MAANDKEALKDVSPDGTVTVIRLDSLSEGDIKAILAKNHGVEDTDRFIKAARERGVDRLLRNPPEPRHAGQGRLRRELAGFPQGDVRASLPDPRPRAERRASGANPSSADTGPLIEAAGRLCAAQLLSGTAGYTLPDRAEPDGDYSLFTEVGGETGGGPARNALATRLFVGTSEGKLAPTHRQIAEFLAARHVSGLVDGGLPLGADSRPDHRF